MKDGWLTARAIRAIFKQLDPLSVAQAIECLNKLDPLSVAQAIECLNKSIAGPWKGVFPEKITNGKTYGKPNQVIRTMPTAEEYEASENVERGADGMPIFN